MKSIFKAALLCCLGITALPTLAADLNATLSKVHVRFDTHDDDKDHDTKLFVAVKNRTNLYLSQDIAEAADLGGDMQFKDPSTHSFDLPVKSNIALKDLTLPIIEIHIEPHGHDRWIFNYTVTLEFSDGSTFSSSHEGVILDQGNKTYTGVFQS